ncbi:MAG: ABC transporter ATP-binding protein [Spirochaetaceae bacterium]|nr:ABC transporter ATP-binding protein [Spirochaetaceae bacterium]
MSNCLLEVKDLVTAFTTSKGPLRAVDGVSFQVNSGELIGVVGESGSGKSLTSLSIMGLVPYPGKVVSGEIFFEGQDLLKLEEAEMVKIRGKNIAMIFQDSRVSLDPVCRCGEQIVEAIRTHEKATREEARERALELIGLVGIPNPARCVNAYPHELSGGMCQRIMIAIALSCRPKLLIADEPTTALDVTVQAQILELLDKLRHDFDMSVILITHNLGVVAGVADRIAVMYAGQIMELGDIGEILNHPMHPYTQGLIKSIPKLEVSSKRLYSISGTVPALDKMPSGCRFEQRCPEAMALCATVLPEMCVLSDGQYVCCHKYDTWRSAYE